jgi:hypothetical protein
MNRCALGRGSIASYVLFAPNKISLPDTAQATWKLRRDMARRIFCLHDAVFVCRLRPFPLATISQATKQSASDLTVDTNQVLRRPEVGRQDKGRTESIYPFLAMHERTLFQLTFYRAGRRVSHHPAAVFSPVPEVVNQICTEDSVEQIVEALGISHLCVRRCRCRSACRLRQRIAGPVLDTLTTVDALDRSPTRCGLPAIAARTCACSAVVGSGHAPCPDDRGRARPERGKTVGGPNIAASSPATTGSPSGKMPDSSNYAGVRLVPVTHRSRGHFRIILFGEFWRGQYRWNPLLTRV